MPRSGFAYHPLQEKIEAAIWARFTPPAFFKLEPEWMELIIASFRTHRMIEAVNIHEQNQKAKQAAQRAKHRGSGRRR